MMDKLNAAELSRMINAHQTGVRLLFREYGINKPEITENDVYIAGQAFGDPFLVKLFDVFYPSPYSGDEFLGGLFGGKKAENAAVPESPVKEGTKRKSTWEGFKNVFDKVASTATGITTLINAANTKINPLQDGSDGNNTPPPPAPKNNQKTLLLVGIGLVVLLAIVFVLVKTSKSSA